jgi:hypothetical protein
MCVQTDWRLVGEHRIVLKTIWHVLFLLLSFNKPRPHLINVSTNATETLDHLEVPEMMSKIIQSMSQILSPPDKYMYNESVDKNTNIQRRMNNTIIQ